MADDLQFHLYLPQMRLSLDELTKRAVTAEAHGFEGFAMMDHLAPPFALDQPLYDVLMTAMWLSAHTTTLRLGQLVLCDAMRHPAVLAKQAVTLDHASNGRYDLGIGWGSVPEELVRFGVTADGPSGRFSRFKESIEIISRLWTGKPFDYEGEHFVLREAQQQPTPLTKIPLVIGGAAPRTMTIAAEHADWWNVPVVDLPRLDELRSRAGTARVSVQAFVTLIPDAKRRDDALQLAHRRFGTHLENRHISGTAGELVERFGDLRARGVERLYTWFTDFAPPNTIQQFGDKVITGTRNP